jgi:hypothetical protein
MELCEGRDYLIVDRDTDRVTHIQVGSGAGECVPMPLLEYIERGIAPLQFASLPV